MGILERINTTKVPAPPALSLDFREVDRAILGLWKLKHDTFDIAKKLWRSEGFVANRLAWLRDRGAK